MNKIQFEQFVREECNKNGIIFLTSSESKILTIVAQQPCGGFFEENKETPATLGIAVGQDEQQFFEILAHEFSHSKQWLENHSSWINAKITEDEILHYSSILNKNLSGYEVGDIFQFWLEGELFLSSEEVFSLVERVTDVEFDCEKRTVELIHQLNLTIDPIIYAQKANAYLLSYYFAAHERVWPKIPAYSIPELYAQLPTSIDPVFCKNITQKLKNLYYSHCFEQA